MGQYGIFITYETFDKACALVLAGVEKDWRCYCRSRYREQGGCKQHVPLLTHFRPLAKPMRKEEPWPEAKFNFEFEVFINLMYTAFPIKWNFPYRYVTAQKIKFWIKDFFSKCDQIRRKLSPSFSYYDYYLELNKLSEFYKNRMT